MAIDDTGWSEIKKKLKNLLIENELCGVLDKAYKISNAVRGESGFSFGFNQMDLAGNPTARTYLEDIMNNAKDAGGKLIVSEVEKSDIRIRWSKKVDDAGRLTQAQRDLLSKALSSTYGKQKVDSCLGVELDKEIAHVNSIVDSVSDPQDKAFLQTNLAILFLADYHNQYHLDKNGKLHKFLKGESVELQGKTIQKKGVLDWADLMNFYSKTKYNLQLNDKNQPNWMSSGNRRAKNAIKFSGADDQDKLRKIVDDAGNGITGEESEASAPVLTTLQVSFPLDTGKGTKVDGATVKAMYEHTERETEGGYFPIGANTVWHGGLHLFANEGSDVIACMPGKIVAARLGETEELAKGPRGHSNFILLQHTVKGKPCFSLYMHLQEHPLDESDDFIKKVGWLGKKSTQLKIVEGKERNYRKSPEIKNDNVLGTLKGGDVVDFIEDAPESPWKKVRLEDKSEAYISYDAKVVSIIEAKEFTADTDLLTRLKDGGVVEVNKQVKCGDLLWKTGSFGPKDYHKGMIHWEIFSVDNLVECLKNVNPQRSEELPPLTGDTTGYTNGTAIKVRGLTGPSQAIEDETITLHVDKVNYSDAPETALQKISWLVKSDDKELERFEHKGRVLQYAIPAGYMGKTLKFYAFMKEPSEKSCIKVEVLSGWVTREDDLDDYNIDNEKIKTLLGDLLADNILTRDELVQFYSQDPDGKASQLRKYACKFCSEWGIPDIDAAISRLEKAGFKVSKDNMEPYQWWKAARDAKVDLPESASVWHYNPIAFLEMLGAPPARVVVKSDHLKHGSYDDHGVKNGKGKADGDMHHASTPVKDAQQQLTDMSAYSGAIDGWFYKKMEDAVYTFQKYAEKGMFVIGGVITTLEDKLSGHQKGVIDDKTKAYMDKVTEKGGKIPDSKDLKPRFPLDKKFRNKDYHIGGKSFGSKRESEEGGIRYHAGCDLIAPPGTPIYAVADGTSILYKDFYKKTYYVQVDHGDYTVRYGEVQPPLNHHGYQNPPPEAVRKGLGEVLRESLGKNAPVKRNDIIAYVGQLYNEKKNPDDSVSLIKKHSMCHFELYKGSVKEKLTVKGNLKYDNVPPKKYDRRHELLDPTKFLDECSDE
jgi:murein DD-endopeptidase MepM/ murein hydrolase activator NlpD